MTLNKSSKGLLILLTVLLSFVMLTAVVYASEGTVSPRQSETEETEEPHTHTYSYGSWYYYSDTQHCRGVGCTGCGVGGTEYADHIFSYGAWESVNETQHRRSKYCPYCDYTTYEYSSHSLTDYGEWSYTETEHTRTVSCSCGYSTVETESHSLKSNHDTHDDYTHSITYRCNCEYSYTVTGPHTLNYTDWKAMKNDQHDYKHRRTFSCTECTYSSYETADHVLVHDGTYTYVDESNHSANTVCICDYTSQVLEPHTYVSTRVYLSDTEHTVTQVCSACGHTLEETSEVHSFTYGPWEITSGSDYSVKHQRTATCKCGYSSIEYAEHNPVPQSEWEPTDNTYHRRFETCECGYSRYHSTLHSFTTTRESISDTEHSITKTCTDCGKSVVTYAEHTLRYGNWTYLDSQQHSRTVSCFCGYSGAEYTPHEDKDGDDYCDSCNSLMSFFSVTVPVTLNLTVSEYGEVYAATSAQIVNNSTAPVSVTNIMLSTENGWQLVPYSTNMADAKVNSKLIGFYLNGSVSNGSEILPLTSLWQIDKGASLPLYYDAVVSATSQPICEQVLTVIFVIGWSVQ